MAALETHRDWHKVGTFAVKCPEDYVMHDTFDNTAYGARASFVRKHDLHWSVAITKGYTMCEFTHTATVVSDR